MTKSQAQLTSVLTTRGGSYVLTDRGLLRPKRIREMRRDPTIFLARLMLRSPLIASKWSIEVDAAELQPIADELYKVIKPMYRRYMEDCSQGCVDFGWQPFEVVWNLENNHINPVLLKALLQENVEVLVSEHGQFHGIDMSDDEVVLLGMDALVVTVNKEGDNYYGAGYMANAEEAWLASKQIAAASNVYDKKIAGAHWVIYFPNGKSLHNGEEKDNSEIAKSLLTNLENSGSFAIPYKLQDELEDLSSNSKQQWTVELKESSGSAANFDARLTQQDRYKVRAFGIPERSILEGQFGTKAEADSHGDFALLAIEQLGMSLVGQLNETVIRKWLKLNYGIKDGVNLVMQPLSDSSLAFMRALYQALINNPDVMINELVSLDMDAIKDRLGVPYNE